jgi:DNA-binding PadR family transcriptional regulator
MKGNLTYLIIWILSKKKMNGSEIAKELEKRKGSKPSPGTIYPALKELKAKGLITADKDKRYSLTPKGASELKKMCCLFSRIFYDMKEMASCK